MALKFTGFNALVDQDSPNREPNRARESHASAQNARAIPRPPCAHTSVAHMGAMHESNVRASIGVFGASRAPHANPSDPRRRNDSHEKAKMLSSHAPALRPRGDASPVSMHVSNPSADARARKSSTFPFFGSTHHAAASFARTPVRRTTNAANTASSSARIAIKPRTTNHEHDAIERETRETKRTNERKREKRESKSAVAVAPERAFLKEFSSHYTDLNDRSTVILAPRLAPLARRARSRLTARPTLAQS